MLGRRLELRSRLMLGCRLALHSCLMLGRRRLVLRSCLVLRRRGLTLHGARGHRPIRAVQRARNRGHCRTAVDSRSRSSPGLSQRSDGAVFARSSRQHDARAAR